MNCSVRMWFKSKLSVFAMPSAHIWALRKGTRYNYNPPNRCVVVLVLRVRKPPGNWTRVPSCWPAWQFSASLGGCQFFGSWNMDYGASPWFCRLWVWVCDACSVSGGISWYAPYQLVASICRLPDWRRARFGSSQGYEKVFAFVFEFPCSLSLYNFPLSPRPKMMPHITRKMPENE